MYQVDKAQVTTKMIISTFIYIKNHTTIAITQCYDFVLSYNAFILSRIIIMGEIYSKIKRNVFANGWRRTFSF
jgi:hypothetical protein